MQKSFTFLPSQFEKKCGQKQYIVMPSNVTRKWRILACWMLVQFGIEGQLGLLKISRRHLQNAKHTYFGQNWLLETEEHVTVVCEEATVGSFTWHEL